MISGETSRDSVPRFIGHIRLSAGQISDTAAVSAAEKSRWIRFVWEIQKISPTDPASCNSSDTHWTVTVFLIFSFNICHNFAYFFLPDYQSDFLFSQIVSHGMDSPMSFPPGSIWDGIPDGGIGGLSMWKSFLQCASVPGRNDSMLFLSWDAEEKPPARLDFDVLWYGHE